MKTPKSASSALLEIGVEPLPARFVAPALAQLEAHAKEQLAQARLAYTKVRALGTLRRLAMIVEGLAPKTEPLSKTVLGPPSRLLKDEKGEFTPQARGFAKAQGVRPEDLSTAPSPRGELMVAKVVIPGEPAAKALEKIFPALVSSLKFPKDMQWESTGFRFARPIRSFIGLFANKVVPFELAGVKSGRTSPGASESAAPIAIKGPADYVPALKAKLVIVDPAERRTLVEAAVRKAAAAEGLSLGDDAPLIDKTVQLTEYPVAVVGEFDRKFESLPPDLVTATLTKELDFFPLWVGKSGRLSTKFLGIKNGASENLKEIREGYQRVVQARLDDAVFYFGRDRKTPLPELREKLKSRVYQKELGSLYDKSERVRELAAHLCEQIRQDWELEEAAVGRIASLAYADLVSEVVGAFPELQGRIGGYYARLAGEDERVAMGIQDFYRPEAAKTPVPATNEGALASLAGKLDTIAGDFAIGLIPTGSEDPHGLRRHALGAWRIVLEKGLPISLTEAISKAVDLQPVKPADTLKLKHQIEDFLWQRAEGALLESGFPQDEIKSVRDGGLANVPRTLKRLAALHAIRTQPEFASLAAAYKRANNILRQSGVSPAVAADNGFSIDPGLLNEEAERSLFSSLQRTEGEVRLRLQDGEFEDSLKIMVRLKPPVDAFFEKVLVNAEDPAVRSNRLNLLAHLVGLFRSVADLSQLQG